MGFWDISWRCQWVLVRTFLFVVWFKSSHCWLSCRGCIGWWFYLVWHLSTAICICSQLMGCWDRSWQCSVLRIKPLEWRWWNWTGIWWLWGCQLVCWCCLCNWFDHPQPWGLSCFVLPFVVMHAHIAAISYCFARGHILFVDEFDGVHTLNVSRALGKAAKFVGKAVMPDCMVFFPFWWAGSI